MRKLFEYFLTLVLGMVIFAGCGGGRSSNSIGETVNPPPSVTGIQVTPASAEVPIDTGDVMRATAYFSDDSYLDVTIDATWTSSDDSIVEVDNDTGYAHALSTGAATLTATYEAESDTSVITVTAVTLDRIDVTPIDDSVAINFEVKYTATGYFSDNSVQNITPFVTWNNSNPDVATILSNGLASTVGAGTTTIEARLNSVSGSTTLEVTEATLSYIELLPESEKIELLGSVSMYVRAYCSDDTYRSVTSQSILISSNDQIAMFEYPGYGTIKGVSSGRATITATFQGESATSTVRVLSARLESIAVSPAWYQAPAGRTLQYTALGYYANGHHSDITNFATWQCKDRTATIESGWSEEFGWIGGFATAIIPGHTALIEASYEGVTGYAELSVLP
jgi:uncharacterized protein YjdB